MPGSLPKNRGGIITRLEADLPDLRFVFGRKFAFRAPRTIVVPDDFKESDSLLVLHEVGHALTGRFNFQTEAERLRIEVLAWGEARKLAEKYGVFVDEDLIQGELDTYRNWLHQKSRCPNCGLTRFQTPDGAFHCPRCEIN